MRVIFIQTDIFCHYLTLLYSGHINFVLFITTVENFKATLQTKLLPSFSFGNFPLSLAQKYKSGGFQTGGFSVLTRIPEHLDLQLSCSSLTLPPNIPGITFCESMTYITPRRFYDTLDKSKGKAWLYNLAFTKLLPFQQPPLVRFIFHDQIFLLVHHHCWSALELLNQKSNAPLNFHAKINVPPFFLHSHQSLGGTSPFPFLVPVDRSVSAWSALGKLWAWSRRTLGSLSCLDSGDILACNLRLFLLPEIFCPPMGCSNLSPKHSNKARYWNHTGLFQLQQQHYMGMKTFWESRS